MERNGLFVRAPQRRRNQRSRLHIRSPGSSRHRGPYLPHEPESSRFRYLAPEVGLEPTTLRLTAGCSAIELLRNGVLPRTGRAQRTEPELGAVNFSPIRGL